MKILIVGTEENLKECKAKFGESHAYQLVNHSQVAQFLGSDMVVFDFDPIDISLYNQKDIVVFLNSAKTTLKQLIAGKVIQGSVFGFCGMPSFLNREVYEVTTQSTESASWLEKICTQLNTNFKIVEDRVGMITPRIICMIINEAYFAIEENVASRTDIDLAMKLGTNYPFGPFEWCEKIGIRNVYELLSAVYNDTKDERYKICELLKKEALA